ncbi:MULTISPECIES: class I SAM-dependent methyltransferase [Actinomadura]|uniref:Class I SAM-dependent methyltransferase n=1 Tax=Actinomadura yumaensis TaxID=111807 RepID=A0ABW2CFN0_9ACTN|nr:class I SAM-dependent methyltransferase [Actinomadura sp. J1-007]
MNDAVVTNRNWWDALADRHGRGDDDYYDVDAFLSGESSLTERERTEVAAAAGDVSGLDLLHLQCHFGLDTLSWAREGAQATGVDFSAVAVERARKLAAEAKLSAEFVESDVLALPESLSGRFDVVFASYGVLCWIRSAAEWMASAAACLRPGGSLVLIDMHPLVTMTDTVEPLVVDFPYAGERPVRFSNSSSYAVNELSPQTTETVQYPHGIGEVVSAVASAGLRVESLTEWFDEDIDPKLVRSPDGRMRFPFGDQWLPTSYGLRARRP